MNMTKHILNRLKSDPFISTTYERLIGNKKTKKRMQRQREEIQNNSAKYLNLVESIMSTSGALYHACFGTLLGIVRDNKLIKWDVDIDYAVVISDDFSWNDLEKAMSKSGFKKIREFVFEGLVTEQTYQVDKITIDFFGEFYDGNNMIQYTYNKLTGVKYSSYLDYSVFRLTLPRVDKIKQINIDGVNVSVPCNSEEILASVYNDDWRVPNPNWKSNSGKCVKFLDGKIAHQVID
ncbi:MAG: hypothetical protein MSS24_08015 [Clostridiales bacterium]|nr:hypothetical protein [Clostridiales bacterium]